MEKVYTGRKVTEFETGEVITTPKRIVTEAQMMGYAGLSGDYNPLHMDESYATPFHGGCIVHGGLTFVISAGLFNRYVDGTCIAFLELNVKYTKAVRIGDVIYMKITVLNTHVGSKGDKGVVTFGVQTLNQNDEPVLEGEFKLLLIA